MKAHRKQVKPILEITFPDYTGRKITVEPKERITFYDCNWSGGTKNEYKAIRNDGETSTLPTPAPWVNPFEGKTVDMRPDIIIVEHSYFCGKDIGITIHIHPDLLPKMLNEPVIDGDFEIIS